MILRKTIFRTIKEKKFQYAGVIVLLVLAVMLYVSLSMAISTLEERNNAFTDEYKQESFHLVAGQDLETQQMEEWERAYDVTLEKRFSKDVELGEESTLRLFTITEDVNRPYIGEGSMPKTGEIAVAEVFATENEIELGDSVDIGGEPLKVSGFVYLPDYIYMIKRQTDLLNNPEQFGIGITNERTLDNLGGAKQVQLLGWTENGKIPDGIQTEISQEVPVLQFVSSGENARIQFVESEIEGSQTLITTLPLFILALSIAMVLMLMKRRLELQRKEIGTLMALGYRKKELRNHYLGYAWFIGLTGTGLGLLAGAGFSVPLSNIYADFFNLPPLSMFDWDPMILVIGLLIPLALLLALTAFVISRTLRTEPLTLLRPKEMASGKKSWLEKLPFMNRGSFTTKFRLRLLARNKARSLYIFIGVMFSTVLLLFGFIAFHSMERLVTTTYEDIQTYDYAVYYSTLQTEQTEEGASPFSMAEITVGEDTKANLYGIQPDTSYIQLKSDEETLNPELSEGAVISRPLAIITGATAGDELTITNGISENELTVEIAGVADLFIGNALYLPKDQVNEFLGYPQEAYTAVWQDGEPQMSDRVFLVEDKQEVIDSFESTSGATRNTVAGMAVVAVVIGMIVLTLLTNLIVEENSPSISLFKVMGYHENEVSKLVLNVYTPLVILSYFLSVPIAQMSLEQTMNTLVEETGFLFPTDVVWWMVVVGFLTIVFTYWMSLMLSKRKLKHVSLQEALKKQQD
ncbi:ABC transporter permease [Halobacillus fulvus]|nr:ABC transporter permease [Halobacillus fulvus]